MFPHLFTFSFGYSLTTVVDITEDGTIILEHLYFSFVEFVRQDDSVQLVVQDFVEEDRFFRSESSGVQVEVDFSGSADDWSDVVVVMVVVVVDVVLFLFQFFTD